VDAWAADVAAGHDTGLYAWRRANVAELNARARSWMESSGRLSGPELECPGGTAYRAGDEVVALAPGASLVTSERAVVRAVHLASGAIDLYRSDGREVRLSREEASTERLGYGYATTVHRCQGSTMSRAHLYADGGGRELAYVAMSRGRVSNNVWVVADDLAQAAEDLRRDWSTRRTPTWAIDTGLPDYDALTSEIIAGLRDEEKFRVAALTHAKTKISAGAVTSIEVADLAPALAGARAALIRAEGARADLVSGSGAYCYSEAGRAVADLTEAKLALSSARYRAEHGARWRERHAAAKEVASWTKRSAEAEERWRIHLLPEAARLDTEIAHRQDAVEQLTARVDRQAAASRLSRHRAWELHRTAGQLAAGLEVHRDQLDGIPRMPATRTASIHSAQRRVADPRPVHEPPNDPHLEAQIEF
jgi:hypothetical protein